MFFCVRVVKSYVSSSFLRTSPIPESAMSYKYDFRFDRSMEQIEGKLWSLENCSITVVVNAQGDKCQIRKLYVRDSRQMPILSTELERIHSILESTGLRGQHGGWCDELWHKVLQGTDGRGLPSVKFQVSLDMEIGAIFAEITPLAVAA